VPSRTSNKFQLTAYDINAYKNGESVLSIAERREVSSVTIRTHLNKAGIKTSNQNGKLQLTVEDIDAYQNGESIPSIAKRKQVDSETVRNHLKKAKIKLRGKQPKFQLSIEEVEAYKNGETISSMSTRLTISPTTIAKRLREAGITIREGTRATKNKSPSVKHQYKSVYELSAKDISDYQNGTSASAIGQRYNVSATSVIRKLKRANVRTRTLQETYELVQNNRPKVSKYKSGYELSSRDIWDYKRGTSASAIGRRYKVSASSVIRKLKRKNVRTRTLQESCELLQNDRPTQTTR
jgi:predicted DNA-binding protein YlxM (UPF0122 family)